MFATLVLLFTLHLLHNCLGLQNNNVPLCRRKMVAGAASSLLLPSYFSRRANAASPPPPPLILGNLERVAGIGDGFDMLADKPLQDIDILYPPSLNGTWVCERKVVSVEGDVNQAEGAWKLLGGCTTPTSSSGGDFQKVEEKYLVRFIDLRRTTDGIIGLDGKKYYGDVFDRGYEIEERTGSSGSAAAAAAAAATVVQWDPRAPNTLNYKKSDGSSSPATELKVVQRSVEPQNNKGSLAGSNELIRVTTTTSALFGSTSFDIIYATRVQRRWRRGTTEEGDRVVEGLEIVKTYRVLDGIAGIEFPTSTVKSTIRLTRTYPTRPVTK